MWKVRIRSQGWGKGPCCSPPFPHPQGLFFFFFFCQGRGIFWKVHVGEGIVDNFGESLEISGGVSDKVKGQEGKLGDYSQDPADFSFCELVTSLP